MLKKGVGVLLVTLMFFSLGVYAQDDSVSNSDDFVSGDGVAQDGEFGTPGNVGDEDREISVVDSSDDVEDLIKESESFDEELSTSAGFTSNNPVLKFFDSFSDTREENVAEMRDTAIACNEGDEEACKYFEYARIKYEDHADELEREVSPNVAEEAERTSRAIRGVVVREIAKNVAPGEKDELVKALVKKESNIGNAARIAAKVNELCGELHRLGAWDDFERVCNTGEDAPQWQKKLFKDLTDEQKKEAKEFGNIMSSCFRNSGRNCDCESIRHEGMSSMCITARPLAVECDEGDENSCEKLESIEFPSDLPDYLKEVLDEVESEYSDARYDNHIPKPCSEAGITGKSKGDKEKCFKIMVETEAPPECRDAIKNAGVTNERQAREICEGIMFDEHAPQECLEQGFDNPRDCAKFMKDNFGDFEGDNGGGPDCRRIENSKERLACYDGAGRHFEERFEDRRGPGGRFPEPCRKAGATDRESCEQVMKGNFDERFKEIKDKESECRRKAESQGGRWHFSNGNCRIESGDGKYREFENDREFRFDCSVISCLDGQVCSQRFGCITQEQRKAELEGNTNVYDYDYPPGPGDEGYVDNTARFDCSKLNCGPGEYCDRWEGCKGGGVSGGDGYNSDGSSCNEGKEWCNSQNACVNFGTCTGDYGFDDPDSPTYSTDNDNSGEGSYDNSGSSGGSGSSPEPESQTSPEPSSPEPSSEPAAPIVGNVVYGRGFITGNAFLDYYFRHW
jgi:hypothetical protein